MHRLSPEELKNRLKLDYQVCHRMFGSVFKGEAYRNTSDMEQRKNPITSVNDGYLAKKYRVDFYVKTLIGVDRFSNLTSISFDLDVSNYPYREPATMVITKPVPYSPHFRQGAPVCIGEIWQRAGGHMLLGQLLVHITRLLNWDEVGRAPGYVGWNGEAIAYHKRVYKGRPITEGLKYPVLPADLYGFDPNTAQVPTSSIPGFRSLNPPNVTDNSLFKGKGRT